MDFQILFSFIISVVIIAILPGPDLIFVLLQSIARGKKHGLLTTIGLMTGCMVHTTLVAFGISSAIKQYPVVFLAIKILGAMYLIYLAIKAFTSSKMILTNFKDVKEKTSFELFKIGFLMNVLNPKVALFFLALFPGFLFSEQLPLVLQFYILGGLFIIISFIMFSLVAFFGGIISVLIKKNKQLINWLKWAQVVVYFAISVFILT